MVTRTLKIITLYVSACFFIKGVAIADSLPDVVPDPMLNWVTSDYSGDVVNPITATAPESWQDAVDSGLPAYYIDSSHIEATDTNNSYGSPTKPRKTIRETTYAEGSYIEIHGGPYDGGGQIIFTANGTPDKPVWFRGIDSNNKAVISGEVIPKGQYLFIENLQFENKKSLSLRTHDKSSLSNVVIRNLYFTGTGDGSGSGSAIPIYSTYSSNRFHDILLYDNEISYIGNDYDDIDTSLAESVENDYHGIHPDINVDRVWIFNNKIHHLGGDSVQVSRASTSDTSQPTGIYIVNNTFYSNLENGVDVKAAKDILIYGNNIYDWREHKGNTSTGSAIVVHNEAQNTWIINNEISDAADAIIISDSSKDSWVIGNIIYDIKHSIWDESWDSKSIYSKGSAIHFRGGSTGGAVNNTIYKTDKGIESASAGLTFINNIIFERNESSSYDINIGTSTGASQVSNNLIFHSSFQSSFNNTECISCLYTSPDFYSVSDDGSFKTNSSSSAIGSGIAIDSILAEFQEVFSTSLSKDIKGGERVVGSIDIGAYEDPVSTAESSFLDLPNAPEILDIIVD